MSTAAPQAPAEPLGAEAGPQPVRWDRDAYYRLGDLGFFEGRRTELIDGEIFLMSPQGPSHTARVDRVYDALRRSGWADVWVRMQFPLNLGLDSEPEPDVSVVAGSRDDYRAAHPTSALLVVEVSDTTLAYDRGRKAALYARAGVADYWILNLPERCLEIRRDPRADAAGSWQYAGPTVLRPGESAAPLAAPGVRVEVADLLG